MPHRGIFAWNTMISAYCASGILEEARALADAISGGNVHTGTILLSGQARLGRVLDASRVFDGMLERNTVTWNAMASCYVRNGDITMSRSLFGSMLSRDVASWNYSVIWSALLGACKIHKNAVIGRRAAEKLFATEPSNAGNYVMLSNICSSLGMWVQVAEVRRIMKQGVTKEPGCSWMQIRNKVHTFITGDKQHEQIKEIKSTLQDLYTLLRTTGYVPDTEFVLHDIDEEQKQSSLLYHSEKLAVAYGLLVTPKGMPI
ncbi:hypothetical protein QYE76_011692 [Lolium multiflorum]|uniref:DYW domain-containing protein n=1 Tax=Lolium multiflorum TaxID=4521 RepID=A0AAD8TZN4_LOLMU|nr:hypothetical protein QYE76_011692 [Lolium multiflorum]